MCKMIRCSYLILFFLIVIVYGQYNFKIPEVTKVNLGQTSYEILEITKANLGQYNTETPKITKLNLRLSGNIKPLVYWIELEPLFEPEFFFKGTTVIQFHCIKSMSSIILHTKNLTIDGTSLALTGDEKFIVIPQIVNYYEIPSKNFLVIKLSDRLNAGQVYKLGIKYKGVLGDDLTGFYRSSYKDAYGNTRWLATTQFQPTDARKAFPCFDEPAMKAVFHIAIIRPKNMIALSNAELLESMPREDKIVDYFKPTVQMSTYLVAFVVCDFVSIESSTKRGVKVQVWAQKDLIEDGLFSLNLATKTIDFYENYFRINFQLNKIDLIAIPDFSAGAMENWGLVTFRESRLLLNENKMSTANKQNLMVTVTHEIAHQWFGNLVTMEWWDDLWLNEAFASAMEYIAANYIYPEWEMDNQFVGINIRTALEIDGFTHSHPVSASVEDPDEIDSIFDDISYSKGAALIRMMEYILGSNIFRNGLNKYLRRHSYKNAVQNDLWKALTEAASDVGKNIDVSKTMDTWTCQKGYPVVTILRDVKNSGTYIIQKYFAQYEGAIYPNDKLYRWEIPLTLTLESERNWNNPHFLWLHQTNETVKELVGQKNEWVIANCRYLGFYRVNYDVKNWQMLINQLQTDHKAIHPNNRAQILYDSLSLARAGLLYYEIALATTTYLHKETDYTVWKMALTTLNDLYCLLEGLGKSKSYVVYIMKKIYPSYSTLSWKENNKDPHLLKLFKYLIFKMACRYEFEGCIAISKELFSQWMASPMSLENPDLKQLLACNGVKFGSTAEWQFIWEQYLSTPVASEKEIYLSGLCCTKDEKKLQMLLNMVLESSEMRKQDGLDLLSKMALQPLGYKFVWKFIKNNWTIIRQRFGSNTRILSTAVMSLSSFFVSQQQLDEVKEFYNQNLNSLGSLKPTLEKCIEKIQGNAIWAEKYQDKVVQWFNDKISGNEM